jgi:hypothetical protein
MGIVLGALGGLGSAMQDMGLNQQKAFLEQDNQVNASNLALQREQALEVFKTNLQTTTANQQREAQTSRINNAASGIVTGQLADKYASSDAAVAAAQGGASPDVSAAEGNDNVQAALTPEQQAVIDQSKTADKTAMMADPNTRVQAAIQTGDIPLKDVMNNASKAEISQMKMDALLQRAQDHNATAKEIADIKTETQRYGYELRLQAQQEKLANGHVDTATGRMMITGEDANIKASTSLINTYTRQLADMPKVGRDGKPNPDYIALQDQINEERDNIKAAKQNKVEISKQLGFGGDATPKPGASSGSGDPTAADMSGPMGTTTAIIDENLREIQKSIQGLDPSSKTYAQDKADLIAQADDYVRQRQRLAPIANPGIVAPAKPASAASGTKDYSKLWK